MLSAPEPGWTTSRRLWLHHFLARFGGPDVDAKALSKTLEIVMFITPTGEEVFVIDGHTHFWDGSPANQRNIHGKQFIDCFYTYHTSLSPPDKLWPKDQFEKYSAEQMYHDLFVDGPDDMAIVQSTYLTEFY